MTAADRTGSKPAFVVLTFALSWSLWIASGVRSPAGPTTALCSARNRFWALSHSSVAWVSVTLMWLCAGYCLIRMRRHGSEPAISKQR